ncbi:MAG: hypothetical protein RLY86_2858 [Pseudomonadota bacterium]|jgi:iron complex outermembrane receptor protein
MKIGFAMAGTALAVIGAVCPALAQPATGIGTGTGTAPLPPAAAGMEEIVILGRGETRQVQTLTANAIALSTPGTSPLLAIQKLPGVSFQSADPFGAYEWSARIAIRGFNQNQLGFTMDGVPLGDMSYGNHNGLHISRAIIAEDVGSVTVAQGAGALGTASTSNLGGTLQFAARSLDDRAGGFAAVTGGSENTWRGVARLETGALDTGTKLGLTAAAQNADKWKGDGIQKQQQVNARFEQPVGKGSLTGWLNWSKRRENDYQDLSLAMIRRLGYGWDNISDDWALAVRVADIGNNRGDSGAAVTNAAAGTVYPAPIQTLDDAYFDAAGLRDDTIGALTLEYPVTDRVTVNLTGYGHTNDGQGIWFTPYVTTPGAGGAPISVRTTEYGIDRYGLLGDVSVIIGDHTVTLGGWYETNDFTQARRFYGLNRANPGRSSTQFQRSPFATQWAYDFETTTRLLFIADSWAVTEALTVDAGFKAVKVENEVRTIEGSPVRNGSIESEDNFLPQVAAKYEVNESVELFASFTQNMRAFVSAATTGPFSTSAAGFAAIRDSLKPERSNTVEAGLRVRLDGVQASATGYFVDFQDRLLSVTLGPGIVGNPAALQNVGSVTTTGLEGAVVWDLTDTLSLFGSATWNQSEYDDDVRDGAGAVIARTGGKTVVDTPEFMAKGEFGYDDDALFAKLGVSYTGKRYYTYLNDASVDGYTLMDLTVGYRFSGSAWAEDLEIQANVTNLLDEEYVSTIGSNGFTNSDPTGTSQTLLAGAPRQVFVSLRKRF